MATPATVSSPYTDALIKEHASSITTSLYSSVELVTLAETLFFTQHLDLDKLHTELDRLNINKDIDVLVLGCTHFPILAKPISDYFNTQVQLLDSGAAIAKRVSYLLKLSNNQAGIKKPLHYYATADVCSDKLAVKQVTLFDPTLNDKS